MQNIMKGKAVLPLGADPSGSVGYTIEFEYKYDKENSEETIEYSKIMFSGPGSWDDFSEGDEYPFAQMYKAAVTNP